MFYAHVGRHHHLMVHLVVEEADHHSHLMGHPVVKADHHHHPRLLTAPPEEVVTAQNPHPMDPPERGVTALDHHHMDQEDAEEGPLLHHLALLVVAEGHHHLMGHLRAMEAACPLPRHRMEHRVHQRGPHHLHMEVAVVEVDDRVVAVIQWVTTPAADQKISILVLQCLTTLHNMTEAMALQAPTKIMVHLKVETTGQVVGTAMCLGREGSSDHPTAVVGHSPTVQTSETTGPQPAPAGNINLPTLLLFPIPTLLPNLTLH